MDYRPISYLDCFVGSLAGCEAGIVLLGMVLACDSAAENVEAVQVRAFSADTLLAFRYL